MNQVCKFEYVVYLTRLSSTAGETEAQRDIRCSHHSLEHILLHSSLRGRHSAQLIEHDHECVALDVIFVYPLYLYKRLGGDHEQLKHDKIGRAHV